jgi:hypothetical protein
MRRLTFFSAVAVAAALSGIAYAQSVISARAGLVHYTEGEVFVGDKPIDVGDGKFAEVKNDEVLRTGYGRAEVLLTPGSFLRLSENSSVRMLSTKLTDARVEALAGDLLIEFGNENKDDALTLVFKDKVIHFKKSGIYRLNAEEGVFRVYSGEATVAAKAGDQEITTVKEAREVALNAAVLSASKFDNKKGDPFFRWASQRAGYIATANLSAARSMRESGRFLSSGVWSYNPWFNMFTYVPYDGLWYSPFGYSYWSPASIGWMYHVPYSYWYRGYNGYTGGGGSNPSMAPRVPSRNANRAGAVAMGRSAGVARSGRSAGGFGADHGGFSSGGFNPGFGGGRGVGYSGGGSIGGGSVSSAPAATGASAGGGGGAARGGGHR